MKKLSYLALFSCLFLFLSSTVPAVNLKNLQGQDVSSTSIIGNDSLPTVVLFWATWCHPCVKELEAVNEILPEWKEKYKFNLVAISVDDARTSNRVASFVKGKAWEMEILLDANSDFKRAMNVSSVPNTIVFDKDGNVVYNHVAYAPGDEEELEKIIAKYSK